MALIEIDGLPNLIAWWIFPWRTVSHNQMVVPTVSNNDISIIMSIPIGFIGVPYDSPQFFFVFSHDIPLAGPGWSGAGLGGADT